MTSKKNHHATGGEPRFDELMQAFATDSRVTYGKMFASMGLKVKGKIFAMLVRGRLVLKLPKGRVDELVRSRRGEHFEPGHGRLMKEWVAIADADASWTELAGEACGFVSGKEA